MATRSAKNGCMTSIPALLFDGYPLQPAVDGLSTETLVPSNLLRGDLPLLGQLV